MSDKEKNTSNDIKLDVVKKRPPQEVIDKMNRIIVAAAETGKTPGELEDDMYREMLGMDE